MKEGAAFTMEELEAVLKEAEDGFKKVCQIAFDQRDWGLESLALDRQKKISVFLERIKSKEPT